MTDEDWHPLDAETAEEIAAYKALREGVPGWMADAFWTWTMRELTVYFTPPGHRTKFPTLDNPRMVEMCQILQIPFISCQGPIPSPKSGQSRLARAEQVLVEDQHPLSIADYLLRESNGKHGEDLEKILERCNSAWRVGRRLGAPGLERRVDSGVQASIDAAIDHGGAAAVRLADAWTALYGLQKDPSKAYSLAIKAVEHEAHGEVSPKDSLPTLGKMINVIRDQEGWTLPLESGRAHLPPKQVILGMMSLLWHGQRDRHGSQMDAEELTVNRDELEMTEDEAKTAVGLAVTLVHWFRSGVIFRAEGA